MFFIRNVTLTPNPVNVGQTVLISLTMVENPWGSIKTEFDNWNDVKFSFLDWEDVKNHEPNYDCIFCTGGYALYDSNNNRIALEDGYTLTHSGLEVEELITEVLEE